MTQNNFYRGVRFSIRKQTEYETLPYPDGSYAVIHDGYFDGEKFFTHQFSPIVKCTYFTSDYTIDDHLVTFAKADLKKMLDSGHLHIKSSSEDNY